MFRKIPFSENEFQVIGTRPGMMGGPGIPILNTPVTPRQNFDALFYDKHPYWMPSIREMVSIRPALYNNTLGRGSQGDIDDVFGRHWRFEPTAGGSIVEGGNPLFEDANEWREKVTIPDIDAWDWASAAKENPIDGRFSAYMSFSNGFWFERLISFMDFMNAAMALIDDEQTDAVKELFAAMTDLGCKLVDKFCEYWPQMDLIEVHDDWGAQKAPFFSLDVAYELFVPFMKQLTDRIHAHGRRALLHSCGHNEERVQCFIDGGFDYWAPQTMNDIDALYEKYGDKIVFAVFPKETDIAERSEEEQRALARDFIDRFCKPGKPSVMSIAGLRLVTPAFTEEMYRYSRALYMNQE